MLARYLQPDVSVPFPCPTLPYLTSPCPYLTLPYLSVTYLTVPCPYPPPSPFPPGNDFHRGKKRNGKGSVDDGEDKVLRDSRGKSWHDHLVTLVSRQVLQELVGQVEKIASCPPGVSATNPSVRRAQPRAACTCVRTHWLWLLQDTIAWCAPRVHVCALTGCGSCRILSLGAASRRGRPRNLWIARFLATTPRSRRQRVPGVPRLRAQCCR
jgi:hypothetical protein